MNLSIQYNQQQQQKNERKTKNYYYSACTCTNKCCGVVFKNKRKTKINLKKCKIFKFSIFTAINRQKFSLNSKMQEEKTKKKTWKKNILSKVSAKL